MDGTRLRHLADRGDTRLDGVFRRAVLFGVSEGFFGPKPCLAMFRLRTELEYQLAILFTMIVHEITMNSLT